jgi:hypothetical protein
VDQPAKLKSVTPPDIRLENHGSIMLLRGHTERGMEWICENVDVQQLYGPSAVIEWRYAKPIVDGARAAGLEVRVEQWHGL